MTAFVDLADVEPNVRENVRSFGGISIPEGQHPVLRECFGRSSELRDGPQGFLVDFPADSRTGAHFHPVDQFQVFFPADGARYRSTPVEAPLLHYSDAYTTYGPFSSGPARFQFFTLRAAAANTTAFMPQDRDQLVVSTRRRHFEVRLDGPAPGARAESEPSVLPLIAECEDGLAAWMVRSGPRVELPTPRSRGAGQYHVVVGGTAVAGGRQHPVRSIRWLAADAEGEPVLAGDDGCSLVVMQFPN